MGKGKGGSTQAQAPAKRFRKRRTPRGSGKIAKVSQPDPELRQRANKLAKILHAMGYVKIATRVRECVWRRVHRHIYRCRKRLVCKLCARLFARIAGREAEKVMDFIAATHPDTRFFAVTLTVPDGDNAKEMCARLRHLMGKVHERRTSGWLVADGVLWFIEVHKGKNYGPRAHIHAVVAINKHRVREHNREARERLRDVRQRNRKRAELGRPPLKNQGCPLFAPYRLLLSWVREIVIDEGLDPKSEAGRHRRDVLLRGQSIRPLRSQCAGWIEHDKDDLEPWPTVVPEPTQLAADAGWWVSYACKPHDENADISFSLKELAALQVAQLGPLRGARGLIREVRTALRQGKHALLSLSREAAHLLAVGEGVRGTSCPSKRTTIPRTP